VVCILKLTYNSKNSLIKYFKFYFVLGEPDNNGDNSGVLQEGCLIINVNIGVDNFVDVPCSYNLYSICERPLF
jgi:hypothetical protein